MAHLLWHLSRGPGHQAVISGETLSRLAELGKLDANDLLWRPGLRSWISARSIAGLTPPALPSERANVGFSFASVWRTARLRTRVYARGAYRSSKRVELGMDALLSHKKRHRIFAGILAAWVLVGMGTVIAMREGPADARVASQNSALMPPNAEATAVTCPNAVEADRHLLQETAADRRGTDFALSSRIVSLQLLSGERAVFDPATELLSNSDPVPLPTRKPVAAANSVNTVDVERIGSVRRQAAAAQKRVRQQKAPPFGHVGFNYSPL